MRTRCLWLPILMGFAIPALLRADSPDGNLYVLGIALNQRGEEGSWQRIGPIGGWKHTLAGAFLQDRLYTVEPNGVLWRTDLDTGAWTQVGRAEFGNTAFMFALRENLYTIETTGSLYQVSPDNGSWRQIGVTGSWKNTLAGAILKDQLYTVERSGVLYETDLNTGTWKQIGKAEFANTAFLFAAGDCLYCIERNGSLYRIHPSDGSWAPVGGGGAWRGIGAGAVLKGLLYTAGTDGILRETDLDAGSRKNIGKPDFAHTTAMFATDKVILTIESDGSLYQVNVKPTCSMNDYDWCPEEIEKVFREQGKSFYHNLHVKQILGRHATHANIMGGLNWLRESLTRSDLAVVYVGSHGMAEPRKGWGISTADGLQFWGRELKLQLGRLPCQVLLLIETCTSGGFARSHPEDLPVPPNVTVLCACDEDQSTNNQLDLALGEALYGRADFNRDGTVNLDELIRYVQRRYLEWWPEPRKTQGSQTPVIVKSAGLQGTRPLTQVSPALAAIVYKGGLWSALLEGTTTDQYQVHLLGWSSKLGPYFCTNVVARDSICLPSDGPPLLVDQNGHWYGARLISKDGEKHKVHYLGYNEEEVVTEDRIRYPFVGCQPAQK